MALSSVVSEIFNVENVVTLKSGSEATQGHWKWYHSIDCLWFPISVLCNFVPNTSRFWDIRIATIRVRGHSRASKLTPIDPPPMISY